MTATAPRTPRRRACTRAAGHEQWLAVSVARDEQWRGLVDALGAPSWTDDPSLDAHAGRRAAHDALDERLAAWAATQDVAVAAELLVGHGVPAAHAWDPRIQSRHPQLIARGLYEECEHAAAGRHPVAGLPYRWSGIDRWVRTPTPLFGQDTRDVLTRLLGTSATELDDLEAAGVIGTRPLGL